VRAIVTGAARGLGQAVAARVVRDGGSVALLDVDRGVAETAASLGPSAHPVVADVAGEDDVRRGVAEALDALGGVDLLVNNAGIGGASTPLLDTALSDMRAVLDVNLVGTFLVSREVGRAMVDQGSGGAIVNIASLFGQQGVELSAGYGASKAGVQLLTHTLALELAPHGIRVNAIAPGHMATEMHFDDLRARASARGSAFEDELERVRRAVPLGRHGTGDDVAGTVAWLASADASYVTGQTIAVNGGVLRT
jgi:NAD(P)-dependent dehydrogenase (short-subunit alcohol dehydrogenase family)